MYKDHSNIYNQKTSVAWMTKDSIGPRRDGFMVIADASLDGKHGSHGLITHVSNYSSKNCHQSSDNKWTGDTYVFRIATGKNETGEYKLGVRVIGRMLGDEDCRFYKGKTRKDAL